jgi:hypothetical protein
LLAQTAAEDNAAMQTEPPNADPPKRKRRWFQFSLRSLMIGVTLLAVVCGYVGRLGWAPSQESLAPSACNGE